ncbi:MAG: hypothetical protein ACRENL_04495 [Candidatus Dormibacteria bacterium]
MTLEDICDDAREDPPPACVECGHRDLYARSMLDGDGEVQWYCECCQAGKVLA